MGIYGEPLFLLAQYPRGNPSSFGKTGLIFQFFWSTGVEVSPSCRGWSHKLGPTYQWIHINLLAPLCSRPETLSSVGATSRPYEPVRERCCSSVGLAKSLRTGIEPASIKRKPIPNRPGHSNRELSTRTGKRDSFSWTFQLWELIKLFYELGQSLELFATRR